MKVMIHSQGDWSVGIPSVDSEATVPFPSKDITKEYREFLRNEFLNLYCEIHDVPKQMTSVWFEDECPDCMCSLKDGNCPRCILHQI